MAQQAKSPAQLASEFNEEVRMKLAVTYTTSDGKEFHSEPQIIEKLKKGEKQESPKSKRRRDSEAQQKAFQHEANLKLGRTEAPNVVRKLTREEFAKFVKEHNKDDQG